MEKKEEKINFTHSNRSTAYQNVLDNAATLAAFIGDLNGLKHSVLNGAHLFNCNLYYNAAFTGHLDVMEWLLELGNPLHENVYTAAQAGGQEHIMKWLKEHECPIDEEACKKAAISKTFPVK